MLNWVENPLAPESRLAAAGPLEKRLSGLTPRRRSRVRVWCSSPSSPASPFPSQRLTVNDAQKASTRVASIASTAIPGFPNDGHDGYFKASQNGAATSRAPKVEVSAKGKWRKQHDSSLSEDEPLPLPMTWPDSVPASKEKVAELLSCDPEKQDCKPVIYQWTGDCKNCQGTGLVSFYRKRHEVVSKCINCLGIGSVHKITSRADIQDMDGSRGSSNGSAKGRPGTNGSAWGSPGANGKS